MPEFNSRHKSILDKLLADLPMVRPGKMFGYPAYYAGKKLSICLYEDGVAVKLPEKSATPLLESDRNVKPFRPMDRPKMREWIQITPRKPESLRDYFPVFEESIRYVLSQQDAASK